MKNKLEIREEKFAMIHRWQESGLSQKQFCVNENWSMNNFQYWLSKFRKVNLPASTTKQSGKKANKFVKLRAPEKNILPGNVYSEVVFTNGNRIRFYNAVEISELKKIAV